MSKQALLDEVVRRLEARHGRRVSAGRELSCQCPYHDDHHNSFSISLATGAFQCHVPGCAANGKHGLSLESLAERLGVKVTPHMPRATRRATAHASASDAPKASPDEALSEPVAIYRYQGADGSEVQQVLRYHTATGKTFRQRHWKDDKWIWRAAPVQVPYRLPELQRALSDPAQIVFIVEGEKDVETCLKHGLVATCNAMGAGKWRDEHSMYFRGARASVVIIPDNDVAGAAHAQAVAESLSRYGVDAPVLSLPVAEKGDVSDWFEAGGTADQLLAMAREALAKRPPATRLQSVERAVLGRYMVSPDTFEHFPSGSEIFSDPAHRLLHGAISDCLLDGTVPTPVNVAAHLHRNGALDALGGITGLQAIQSEALPIEDMRTRLEQLSEAHMRRRLVTLSREISALAGRADLTAPTLAQAAMQALERALHTEGERRGLAHVSDLLAEFMAQVERLSDGRARRFLTGLAPFDELVLLEPHRLYLFAGRPGMGKTAWLVYLAQTLTRRGTKVAFYSLEMSQFQVLRRMSASLSQLDAHRIGAPDMSDTEWQLFMSALSTLAKGGLWLSDSPSVDVATLRRQCAALKKQRGLDVVIVDYIGLLSAPSAESETQRLSNIARELKVTANELDVAMIVAAQLNRAVEERVDKRPLLSDLRSSGTLEEHADTVIMLYRHGYYEPAADPRALELIIRKQRDGRLGTVSLTVDLARAEFKAYEPPMEVRL